MVLVETTYISNSKKKYKWLECECACGQYYKVYTQKDILGITWWSRINDCSEITTIDEIHAYIKTYENIKKANF
jgi:hypothetical protein